MDKGPDKEHVQRVLLIHKDMRYRGIDHHASTNGQCKWIYLGRDYLELRRWEEALLDLERISISKLLHSKAWELRRPFVEWIADIGKPYGDSLKWWVHRMAEKNTMSSPLFLYLCYIELCIELLSRNAFDMIIVCEDWLLLSCLRTNLRKEGFAVQTGRGWLFPAAKSLAREVVCFAGKWTLFFLGVLNAHLSAIASKRKHRGSDPDTSKPCAVMRTWIGGEDFMGNGRYKDRYYSTLPDWLRRRGYEVIISPWAYRPRQSLRKLFRALRNSNERFLIPQDDIRLRDYIKGILTILGSASIPRGRFAFRGKEVSRLILRERLLQARAAGTVNYLTYLGIIRRWKSRGFNPDIFIDTFENINVEKPQIAALRRHFPDTKIIGYQHATISPLMLKYNTTEEEFRRGLFPDLIVTNGAFFREKLAQNGFPEERLRVGPSLRFSYISNREKCCQMKYGLRRRDCLVLLGLELSAAVELLYKAIHALKDTGLTVSVKPHPDMKKNVLLDALGTERLPENMEWTEGSLSDCLQSASCAIAMAGSAVMECIAWGIPFIIVSREATFNINPLGWWEQSDSSDINIAYDAVSLRNSVEALLLNKEKACEKTHDLGQTLAGCFTPVNEESLTAFVP